MNVCEPVFERWLIADSFACRKGKGRIAAPRRGTSFRRSFAYFLKLDMRRYFDSVSHPFFSPARRLFKDRRLLDLFERIIRAFASSPVEGCGSVV